LSDANGKNREAPRRDLAPVGEWKCLIEKKRQREHRHSIGSHVARTHKEKLQSLAWDLEQKERKNPRR